MTHGTILIEARRLLEGAQRLIVPKAVESRQPLIKPLLRFARARRDCDVSVS